MGSVTGVSRRMTDGQLRLAVVVLAVGHVALGLWMALSPRSFFDSFAAYGVRNDHYIRDIATFYLALGLVFAAAARRPSWRTPILAFAALQYAFHLVNHVIDVADSHPAWIGPFNVASLAVVELLLVVLLRASRGSAR